MAISINHTFYSFNKVAGVTERIEACTTVDPEAGVAAITSPGGTLTFKVGDIVKAENKDWEVVYGKILNITPKAIIIGPWEITSAETTNPLVKEHITGAQVPRKRRLAIASFGYENHNFSWPATVAEMHTPESIEWYTHLQQYAPGGALALGAA
jgi:hypothetical protein